MALAFENVGKTHKVHSYSVDSLWLCPFLCVYVCVHARACTKLLQLCLTLWDSMDYSPPGSSVHGILQAKYWSRLPCPPPRDLPDPGIKPTSLTSPALAGRFFTTNTTWEACTFSYTRHILTPLCPPQQLGLSLCSLIYILEELKCGLWSVTSVEHFKLLEKEAD